MSSSFIKNYYKCFRLLQIKGLKMRFNTALQTLQNLSNAPVRPVDIAKALGVSRSNINYKKDKNVLLSEDDIRKIEEFFNIKMISPVQIPAEYTQAVKYVEKGAPISFDTISMDYYPTVFGSCGSGSFVFSEEKEKIQVPCRLVQNYSKFKKYSVINATGDSMTPYILDRDRLIVEHYDGSQIRDNKIYIFRYYDNIFVKRLVLNLDQIVVISDNEKYQQRIINRSEADNFQIIGRIAGILRIDE